MLKKIGDDLVLRKLRGGYLRDGSSREQVADAVVVLAEGQPAEFARRGRPARSGAEMFDRGSYLNVGERGKVLHAGSENRFLPGCLWECAIRRCAVRRSG